jgi:hypothetical protein
MKNISTGAGLVVLGLGIALHPLVSGLVAQATAAPSSSATSVAAAVASTATTQAGPTVVWMGVTTSEIRVNNAFDVFTYHRLWSDGRLEVRHVQVKLVDIPGCLYDYSFGFDECALTASAWTEVPPPPGGNGFACRTDINGDRLVDGADLTFVLNAWGQQGGCEPEATYPCLDLGNLAGGVGVK